MAIPASYLKVGLLRTVLIVLTGLVLTSFNVPSAVAGGPRNAHDDGPSGPALAAAHEELTLFEFVGHVEQTGLALSAYGYLTHVYGMDDADLFAAGSSQDETTAKYTFVTKATINSRFVVGGNASPPPPIAPPVVLFYVVSSGTTTYYLRDPLPVPGGCIGVPDPACPQGSAPFAAGTPFATMAGRYSDVNSVQSPGKGVISGTGEVVVKTVTLPRDLKKSLDFWKSGMQMRITYFGEAVLTNLNPSSPQSFALVVGRATVVH